MRYLSFFLPSLIFYYYFPFHDILPQSNISYEIIGMKAYKTINDESDLRLFRPDLNMKRLKNSMERLSMPGYDFDKQELTKCIGELVRVGKFKCNIFKARIYICFLSLKLGGLTT